MRGDSRGTVRGAPARGWVVAALAVAVVAAGCTGDPPPARQLSGPPQLGDWIEIEGRWEVAHSVDDGALLVPAVQGQAPDLSTRPAEDVTDAREARWVDAATGDVRWSRGDLGSVMPVGDGHLAAMVGSGSSRALALVEVATGESVWELPESDLGRCSGWRISTWRTDTPPEEATDPADEADDAEDVDGAGDAGTDSGEGPTEDEPVAIDDVVLQLSAPRNPCTLGQRSLVVEVAADDGAVGRELVTGRGWFDRGSLGDRTGIVVWSRDAAEVVALTSATGETERFELSVDELLADAGWTDTFDDLLSLDLALRLPDRPSLDVNWYRDEDSYGFVRSFRVDPGDGSLTPLEQRDCTKDIDGGWVSGARTDTASCAFEPLADDGAVTIWGTAQDDPFQEWTLPTSGGVVELSSATCEPPTSGDDTEDARELLLARSPTSVLGAHDLRTGEQVWSLEGEVSSYASASLGAADALLVLTEGAGGGQSLRTLRPCSGTVLTQREVSGADVLRGISSTGTVVTLALEDTTLLASVTEPGED